METTPRHCPGWETFRNLKSFVCVCNHCGASKAVVNTRQVPGHKHCAKVAAHDLAVRG